MRGADETMETMETMAQHRERRLDRLIGRLPNQMQEPVRWLRRPASRWLRIPAGLLLLIGGFLSILPFLGLWMLPLGLMLLAEDVPPLRRARERLLDRLELQKPHWFTPAEPYRRRALMRHAPSADRR